MKKMRTDKENEIRRRVKSAQALYDWSNEKLAIKLHMSLPSLERRLAHPNLFRLEELIKIDDLLHTEFLTI